MKRLLAAAGVGLSLLGLFAIEAQPAASADLLCISVPPANWALCVPVMKLQR